MKEFIFLGIAVLISSNLNGMKKPTLTTEEMKTELRRIANSFTETRYPVPLSRYLEFNSCAESTCKKLAEKRKTTSEIDTALKTKFDSAVQESNAEFDKAAQEGSCNDVKKEASKQVVLLGVELLIQGTSYEEIYPNIRKAGNILRNNVPTKKH